ncbi:MAG: glutamine-hydrolyzing carbamoyl-phosphate synthase small subunit [Planctomycetes bacterium]|nr:glutamine-hydrolyzing carbamoyl-phosphate synthase small subunit [Planctomycetota bacterium]MCB9825163.1 glutamine-hydrolyzing carbamoyl-phosphate synthase small subunit [Planctomycetota bacterium]MCB9829392.1 glutamine-hydrolyzing carbamoyl-phosphate synthase small subunit [Planctomycetota bacterium]MCB9901985.1 glutamine-hydrolyzing carbamoyl-phosphate synthase small subunit [Planctomycetota bacterium]
MSERPPALLVLADGTVFRGRAFGARGRRSGEVVFNTSMTGYQEIATDPSYRGQIVTMTYPHIGNYGVNDLDVEAERPWIEGMVVRELAPIASNYRSTMDLDAWFAERGVIGIEGVDTRRLTRRLRIAGAINGVLATDTDDVDALVAEAKALPSMAGMDLVSGVTCKEAYGWDQPWPAPFDRRPDGLGDDPDPDRRYRVVAMDFGIKRNILRSLVTFGLDPHVVPATTSAEEILALEPDGVFLSNGPGDPAAVTYAIETIRGLLDKVPIFGICLGHQLLALAAGAETWKLKFGHRGANHPVRDHASGRIEITSQNHGFVVDEGSLEGTGFLPSHTNLNDMTNAGMASADRRAFAVQYHPEACPGPHDAQHLFHRFRRLIQGAPATTLSA